MNFSRDLEFISDDNFAKVLNDKTFNDYFSRLTLLAVSLFEWTNLPNKISAKYLETSLYELGKILFFNDESDKHLGLMISKCTGGGAINYYDEPTSFIANSTGYHQEYDKDNCILMRDNLLELPFIETIYLFAYRLTMIERSRDINIFAQRTPILLTTTDNKALTIETLYKKYNGFSPVIYRDKGLDTNALKVWKTDAPFIADKLRGEKHDTLNEALTFLGINNANTDKKERLVEKEAESNNQHVALSLRARYNTRLAARDAINAKYGCNIDVKVADLDIYSIFPELKEGNESGKVHNGTKDTD
jgi:hypothetical protein